MKSQPTRWGYIIQIERERPSPSPRHHGSVGVSMFFASSPPASDAIIPLLGVPYSISPASPAVIVGECKRFSVVLNCCGILHASKHASSHTSTRTYCCFLAVKVLIPRVICHVGSLRVLLPASGQNYKMWVSHPTSPRMLFDRPSLNLVRSANWMYLRYHRPASRRWQAPHLWG